MANPEHLEILKQGVEVWNRWREENPAVYSPDLVEAQLQGARRFSTHGGGIGWNTGGFPDPSLPGANLASVNLRGATLFGANFYGANLYEADLSRGILLEADLSHSCLKRANLTGANLRGALIEGADLQGADLAQAEFGDTIFGDTDFRDATGLESCKHWDPSTLDYRTMVRSANLPVVFLRGCGLPETFIEYLPSLLKHPIQFCSCFISYSSKDQEFAERLHADLQDKGVRCWFAPEHMKTGDRIRTRIDESIRLYDKLLLVLSENSISSAWVEKEVETAFEKERERNTTVLFPIRLDDAVMDSKLGWAADIKRSRHIGDFTRWKDHDAYTEGFERLLHDLRPETPTKSALNE